MGVELELKFRATPAILEAVRQAYPQPETQLRMRSTYYDTPQGAFAARHCTLRQRQENALSICTLKTPGQGFGRREFEVSSNCIRTAADALCKLAGAEELAALLSQGLEPVCGAAFLRIAKTLVLPDCTLELALDRGVLTGGGREQPLCEIEAELKEGSREGLLAFGAHLSAQFSLEAETSSKFRRALALAKGDDHG